MTYLVSDLIGEVQDKLGDTSFSPASLLNYANNTNRDIHTKHDLTYMQTSQTFTTTANSDTLGDIPDDLLNAYNLRLTDKQYARKLTFWTFDKFDTHYPQPSLTAPSIPILWYNYGGLLKIYPAASQPTNLTGYGAELRYRLKPTGLTKLTDTPNVPEEFREVMFLGMMKQAMERRQRYDVSQLLDQQYQDRLLDLVGSYGNGALQDSDPYIMPISSYGLN